MNTDTMVLLLLLSIITLTVLYVGIVSIRECVKDYKHKKDNNTIDTLDMHHLKTNDWTKHIEK